MKKLIGVEYLRYSSDRQTEQSIEGQMRVCDDYAARNNIIIVNRYIDRAMTGTNDNRKDFQRMIRDSAKQNWDVVLVYKLDRFSRNKYEMAIHKKTLKDNGIKLVSATENIPDTPEGIILESLLEGMAEYYSAELSQKVKRGMNESRAKGNFTGGLTPYGYKVINKKIYIDEDRAKVVRFIYEKYANNALVKDIIEELNKKGIINAYGKPFPQNSILKILKNEEYIGIFRHGNEVYTNRYPPIIPVDLFEKVQIRINGNKFGKRTRENVFLLRNKLKCGYCGRNVIGESGTSKCGKIVYYYKCAGRKKGTKCRQDILRKDALEKIVTDTAFKIFEDASTLSFVADQILEIHNKKSHDTSTLNILNKELETTRKSIDNLLHAIEQGIISKSTQTRLAELESQEDKLNSLIALEKTKGSAEITRNDIIYFIKSALKKESKQMIFLLIKQITLYNDKIEIAFNYTNSLCPDQNSQDSDFIINQEKIKYTYFDNGCPKTEYLLVTASVTV
ncbi:MAG: recombinase family protein [Clostridia bacterium]|nr:recombinase family protein [Clostridia bacterium]